MDRRFQEIQDAAAADARLAGRVRLLSVSFDPEFDTPAVLTAHAARVGARPGWTFATAPPAVVDRFAAEFGVNVIREADGTITHNLRTAVIGPDGRVAAVYSGNDWTAGAIVDDLRRAIDAS
jgi:protein SCO1/2